MPNQSSAPKSRSDTPGVSTGGQQLERQVAALAAAECRKIFADEKSGRNALRPELQACHAFLGAGDTLVVPSLDRYGRSLQDLIDMVAELRDRGIGLTSLHENLDTTRARAVRRSPPPAPASAPSAPSRAGSPDR
ncbi:recombinase family protein [Streptomyces sp. NPDC003023]|uniref:recombinase family protein n=1 Tax=Streptomyces sp. NPDC003023 TaxID=3364675 RepID=UPI0036756319